MSSAISREGVPRHQCPGKRPYHARPLLGELFEAVLQSHELLTSEPVLRELGRILPGKLGQSKTVTAGFLNLVRTQALLVTTEYPAPPLPDPDDEPILASAIAGKAPVFVTGDKALLELQSVEKLPIISPRSLWEILADRE